MWMKSVFLIGMWMQDPGSLSSGNSRLLMFFVGLVAVAMVVQAIVVVTASIAALKAQRRVQEIAEEVRIRVLPMVDTAESLMKETAPKVRIISDNLVETSHVVRSKAAEFDATLTDVNVKTRAQVARMDSMMSSALAKTAAIGEAIHEGIRVPVKQATGVVNGIRAGLDVLTSRAREFGRRRP